MKKIDKTEGLTERTVLKVSQISYSPANYRKAFSAKDLQDFAKELQLHGIISPLLVRPAGDNHFELIAGERRLRAATIAGMTEVPVSVKSLTDQEVIEYQLAENLQRENPHPLHEAQGIGIMKSNGLSFDEIAGRLGKSKTFIFGRLKLLELNADFQELFLADKIAIREAFQVASIAADAQKELFDEHCLDWKTDSNFMLDDLDYLLRKYRYDLNGAPFDINSKKLLPGTGACAGCPFNTASVKTLFPEYAKEKICTNKTCYKAKCVAQMSSGLKDTMKSEQPVAVLFSGHPSEQVMKVIQSVESLKDLPTYNRYDVFTVEPPEVPLKEDYMIEGEEGEDEELNTVSFNDAMQEYTDELAEFNQQLESGKLKRAMIIHEAGFRPVFFSEEKFTTRNNYMSGKAIQEAIKAGTVTSALLQGEIERLKAKESRSKQLDKEKVQLSIHSQFVKDFHDPTQINKITAADLLAARFIIYQSLDYYSRNKVRGILFANSDQGNLAEDDLQTRLENLSDQEHSYLIRMALACRADSKQPDTEAGILLTTVAKSGAMDVERFEAEQAEVADKRKKRLSDKIVEMQKKIESLQGS